MDGVGSVHGMYCLERGSNTLSFSAETPEKLLAFTRNNARMQGSIFKNITTTMLGTLFIISAPSGAGKTSLVNALIQTLPNLEFSISYTTRQQRSGEKSGINYHFVSNEEFSKLVEQQAFLEHAEVFGNCYGTSRFWVEEKLRAGIDVILEIDWQGAQQIRSLLPENISIFILPPSKEVLAERLQNRAQDDATIIAQRMAAAKAELSHYSEYDYLVVNDEFERALGDVQAIIQARRLREAAQKIKYAALMQNLLE